MELFEQGRVKLYRGDCMELMAGMADNHYDLCIVDPPYGLDKDSLNGRGKMKNRAILMNTSWDVAPDQQYFDELKRVSRDMIIWGGNYYNLPPTRGFIVWDKCQPWENFSKCEFAWTSFSRPSNLFKFDNRTGGKIHPTQKPIALYKWLLFNYATPDMKILDTHLGSGSSAIAAHYFGCEFTGIEIDEDYYKAAVKRFKENTKQQQLFRA